MVQSINLVPQEEIQEQTKTKHVKFSTVFAVLLLVAVVGATGYFVYQVKELNTNNDALKSSISSLRQKISAQADIEISARNLSKRVAVLQGLFAEKVEYSRLASELKSRQTPEISINNFDFHAGEINLSGDAASYIALAEYIDNLLNKSGTKGTTELKDLFTTLSLNSVALEGNTGRVSFSMEVAFDEAKLKAK